MIDGFNSRPKPSGGHQKRDNFYPDLTPPGQNERPHEHGTIPKPVMPPERVVYPHGTTPPSAEPYKPSVDETIQLDNTRSVPLLSPGKPRGPRWWRKFVWWFKHLDKKRRALVIFVAAVFVIAGSVGTYALFFHNPPQPAPKVVVPPPEPEPTTVPNTLTGRQVDPKINERQVTAVIIENSVAARPHAGLQEAGVVFEAIAEGGITRFLALYQDTDPKSIGPVRSLRPYYLSWAQGFDAAIAHVGGSPEALQQIRSRGAKDLDQFSHASYYQRATDRYAPHNMFTTIKQLRTLQDSLGFKSSNFDGFARNEKGEPAETPTATRIQINTSSQNYNSSYKYNPGSNTYSRSMGGTAHTDKDTNKRIKPDVVVAMVVDYSIHSNGVHSVYNTVSSGKVFVFQNGTVTEGTWNKSKHTSNISFSDKDGNPLRLNPGQTWISVVSDAGKVVYRQ